MQVLHLFWPHSTGHIYNRHSPSQSVLKITKCLSHCLAAQIFCIAALLQWAIHRIELRSLDQFQGTKTQFQITLAILCMCTVRQHYRPPLGMVWGRLARLVVFWRPFPIYDLPTIGYLKLLDISILTILGSRILIPQSTSLFTNPCRPFISPFPQCQDLLHAPPTYVVTFWAVLFLLYSTGIALDWFESSMPISFDWHRLYNFLIENWRNHLALCFLRLYIFFKCFNFAIGEPGPHPPHFTNNSTLFAPYTFFKSWILAVAVGMVLYVLAVILCNGGSKLGVALRLYELASRDVGSYQSLLTQRDTKMSYPSTILTSSDPIYSSSPRTPPRRSQRCYRKRPSLTPETFRPPQGSSHLACILYSPASIDSPDFMQTPVDLADISATRLEKVDLSLKNKEYSDDHTSVFIDMRDQQHRPREFIVMKTDLLEDIESELSEEEDQRLPIVRPPSRLAFNDDDGSPRWANLQIYEEDWDINGGNSLYRSTSNTTRETGCLFPVASPYDLEPPLTPDSSTTSFSSNSSHSPPSPTSKAPLNKDPALYEDLDKCSISPTKTSYDWVKAATFLQVTSETDVGEVKRERVFHLARIPNLYTIDEETTEEPHLVFAID